MQAPFLAVAKEEKLLRRGAPSRKKLVTPANVRISQRQAEAYRKRPVWRGAGRAQFESECARGRSLAVRSAAA